MNINFYTPSVNFFKKECAPKRGPKLNTLTKDTVSFGKRFSERENLKNLPAENYPSKDLYDYIQGSLNNPKNKGKGVYEFHKEYFSGLLECSSLEEAKAMYPEELKGAINFKDLDKNSYPKNSIVGKIYDGKYEGLTPENATFELIKRYWGEVIPTSPAHSEEYFGMSPKTIENLFDLLNIRMDQKYRRLLKSGIVSSQTRTQWQTGTFREDMTQGMKNRWQDEKYREVMCQAASDNWRDPIYRQTMQNAYGTEEYHQKRSEISTKMWQSEEHRRKIEETTHTEEFIQGARERAFALWQDPDYAQRVTASRNTEEYLQLAHDMAVARWQNPVYADKVLTTVRSEEYRQMRRDMTLALWENEEYWKKHSDAVKKRWKTKEQRERMEIVFKARTEVFVRHPELRKVYTDTALDFPWLSKIVSKKERGIELTETEFSYLQKYYKACHANYPGLAKVVGQYQREILAEWGFYDKDKKAPKRNSKTDSDSSAVAHV